MTARAYLRVSSIAQAEKFSLTAQREKAEAWARYQGIPSLKVYEERGVSGKRDDRPQLLSLMDDLQSGDTVVVYALSRLGRGGAVQLLSIVRDIEAKGARLVSLTENIDTVTPAGRLLLTILAALTEMEIEITRERANLGREVAAAQGIWPHKSDSLPLGWARGEDGRIVEGDGADLVREIIRLSAGRTPFHRVATELNARGIPSRTGKQWRATTVARVASYPGYHTGEFIYRAASRPDEPDAWIRLPAPALVTRDEWEAAQRGPSGNPIFRKPDVYPLTGHLRCACGSVMNGSRVPMTQGGHYHYYGCRAKLRGTPVCPVTGQANRNYPVSAIDARARAALADALGTPATLAALLTAPDAPADPHREERERLEQRRSALIDLHLEALIDRAEFLKRRDDLTARIQRLTPAVPQVELPDPELLMGYQAAAQLLEGEDYAQLLKELRVRFVVDADGAVGVGELTVPVV